MKGRQLLFYAADCRELPLEQETQTRWEPALPLFQRLPGCLFRGYRWREKHGRILPTGMP